MKSKKQLAVTLQQLKNFSDPKIRKEQYATDADVAADMLWEALMQRDIDGKIVADLGAGTGILGLGALLLGAQKVFFVEENEAALEIAKENLKLLEEEYELGESIFIVDKVKHFNEKVEVVIENPPFGTKEKHADKIFLEKAFSIASIVYSLHKTETKGFIESITKDHGFSVAGFKEYSYPLKASFKHNRKDVGRVSVGLWILKK